MVNIPISHLAMADELSDQDRKDLRDYFHHLQEQIDALYARVDGHDKLFGPADQIAGELERLNNEVLTQSNQMRRLEERLEKIELKLKI